ncbi:sterol esterase [Mycena leptocephala]|nr:sterol esterase [Mycena leptocephala]
MFLGVPFAQAARFEIPRTPKLLHGVQNATEFGPACPQQLVTPPLNLGTVPLYPSISEDCLTLDVFKPTDSNATPSSPSSCVRLFGSKEVGTAGISNLGLRDQVFALEWVQEYVSASVEILIVWSSADRNSNALFRGAVMFSGSGTTLPSLADGQSDYDGLVTANNCTAAPDTLDCLRRVPFDAFMATVNKTPNFFSYQSLVLVWRPRIDGDLVLADPMVSISWGAYAKHPVMSGNADDEGTLFSLTAANVTTDAEFLEYVHSIQLNMFDIGVPFGTGTAFQLTPEYKRLSAFAGDMVSSHRVDSSLSTYLKPRMPGAGARKDTELGSYHTSDTSLWFTSNTTTGETIAVDALSEFGILSLLELDCASFNFLAEYSNSSLLTFNDPDRINTTADNFRIGAIAFLNDLLLSEALEK